jgi:hypothetical protein
MTDDREQVTAFDRLRPGKDSNRRAAKDGKKDESL